MLMEKQRAFYEAKLAYEIDSWDLNEILNDGKNVVVLDARSPGAYEQEHIPGAVSFPHRTMNEETTKHLDKESLYVAYCDGIGCNASTRGALKMAKLGFTVQELLGGLDWWKRDGYPTKGKNSTESTQVFCNC